MLLGTPETAEASDRTGRGPQRIGVLGGTFDPPHVGHLWLAALAADAIGLDRVLFMPAAEPPHKRQKGMTRATDRLLMTRLAIAGDDAFELTLIEMERPGPSYTIDSVDELQRSYGTEARLYLLMATDSLGAIDAWREPDALLERIEWVVGPRPGSPLPDRSSLEGRFGANASRIHLLSGPSLDVSSTEIRRRVAAGHTIRYLVPRGVEELIAQRGLYRRG
ncbi:MAG TPA: nicotinate-nucleotide adenylyltransferase [Candidatus Binatia bacterium]|nr:nicotinate-nucleotide adenylyltransferase [Candidatus Binatia bacterium]